MPRRLDAGSTAIAAQMRANLSDRSPKFGIAAPVLADGTGNQHRDVGRAAIRRVSVDPVATRDGGIPGRRAVTKTRMSCPLPLSHRSRPY